MTQNLRYTHMQGKKKKSFALLTMTGKKLPERCLIIDHNILVLKKILKKKNQYFQAPTCQLAAYHVGTARQAAESLWEMASNHIQNQCQWKSKRCSAPSPPATSYKCPPNKSPFWHWPPALKYGQGIEHSALCSPELNHRHNYYYPLSVGRLRSALKHS